MNIIRVGYNARSEVRGRTVYGLLVPYLVPTAGIEEFRAEQFERGSFTEALKMTEPSPVALWDHNTSALLGRSASGTLRMRDSRDGVMYEIDLPDTSLGRDIEALARRDDIGGASVGFYEGDFDFRDTALGRTATHTRVDRIRDASLVALPAYAGTTTAIRHEASGGITRREQLIRARARVRSIGKR